MTDPAMLGVSKYERAPDDLYETPEWVTEVLLRHVSLGKVWEPACGRGAIARVLARHGLDVAASDLRDHGYGVGGIDFLTSRDKVARDIVTNPPYDLADEFVRHALEVTAGTDCLVAMLLRNEWDCAARRDDLFKEGSRFMAKVILTNRPRWIPGSTVRPRHNFAWYVWSGAPVADAIIKRGQ